MIGHLNVTVGQAPLVTVVVSSYNRPRLISDALLSVVNESNRDSLPVELIVADDWSSHPMVAAVSQAFNGRLWRPPTVPTLDERQWGLRCAVVLNSAMPLITGRYLTYLPDDDFLTPGGLAARVHYLEAHPEVDAVYGRLEACHPKGGTPRAGLHWAPEGTREAVMVRPDCAHDRLGFWQAAPLARAANVLDHGMVMVRTHPGTGAEVQGFAAPVPLWPTIQQMLDGKAIDCPDANWFLALEQAGYGPFHGVDHVCTVKRYHNFGHRTDPIRRE